MSNVYKDPPYFTACEICLERPANQRHHVFPQSDRNRKLYPDFIDDRKNIVYVCVDCHPRAIHRNEKEFCELFGIKTRSKCGKL